MSRKQPKRRILVKQLLRHGQVWFIRRYGYIAWKNVALDLNDRKDIRLGWALTDESYDYITKMRMFYGQFRVHEAMGATPSRELFTDRIKADQLIADVPLYSVTVDGKPVYNAGEGFHWLDGEGLWQAMSEELTDLVPDGDDDRLEDWQDLPDDDIETLLQSAKEEGFIKDYDIEEA